MLAEVEVLPNSEAVFALAETLVIRRLIPVEAKLDALHVASAAVASVDYLVTQNFTHIANAKMIPAIYAALGRMGFGRLLICTPAEFLGGLDNGPQ